MSACQRPESSPRETLRYNSEAMYIKIIADGHLDVLYKIHASCLAALYNETNEWKQVKKPSQSLPQARNRKNPCDRVTGERSPVCHTIELP